MGCWSLESLQVGEFIIKVERHVTSSGEQYLAAQRLNDGHMFYADYLNNRMGVLVDKTPVVFAIACPHGASFLVQGVLEDRNVKYYNIDLAFDLINSA